MAVQAAVAVLLARLGAGTDIPLGMAVAGRGDQALDGLAGFFVNTLVLRADVSGDPSLAEVIGRVREADLAAFAHQDLPFEQLVEALAPERSLARNPLFQVMTVFQNAPRQDWQLPGVEVSWTGAETGALRVDLSFYAWEQRDRGDAPAGIAGYAEFAADLFDAGTAEAIAGRLARVLAQVAADPQVRVSQVEILDPAERRQLLGQWNDTARPVPDVTLAGLFEAQAARTPHAPAVRWGGGELSYAELDAAASSWRGTDRAGGRARAGGGGSGAAVGADGDRATGGAKAGAAYLPVDADYPADRIGFMLADAGPVAVLTTTAVAGLAALDGLARVVLDDPGVAAAVAACPASGPGDRDGWRRCGRRIRRMCSIRRGRPGLRRGWRGRTGGW